MSVWRLLLPGVLVLMAGCMEGEKPQPLPRTDPDKKPAEEKKAEGQARGERLAQLRAAMDNG